MFGLRAVAAAALMLPAGLGGGAAAATPAAAASPAAPELLRRAELLPASDGYAIIRRAAPCAFAPGVHHLDPLPAAQPWTRPAAIVVFEGLPGQPDGVRAVLARLTRTARARRSVAEALARGEAIALDLQLGAVAPGAAGAAAYTAILVPPEAAAGATSSCTAQGNRQ